MTARGRPVIAVFTKNRTNPAYTAARLGADRTGAWLGARIVHYVPRRPDSIEDQARRVEQAIGERADAVVFVPVHATAMNESVGIRDTGYGFEAKAGEAGLPHYVSLISHLVSRISYLASCIALH